MKLLPMIFIAAAIGGGLGVAMAYTIVGPAESDPFAAIAEKSAAKKSAASPAASVAPASQPQVVVDEPTFNFGVMQKGAKRSHAFVVRNEGDTPLVLTAGETTCKCTDFVTDTAPVPPGGETQVKLEWVAKTTPGPFRQKANLKTSDPSNPLVELYVEGEVVEPTGLFPRSFALGRIGADQRRTAAVVLMTYDQDELEVTADPPVSDDESVDGETGGKSRSEAYSLEVEQLTPENLPDERAKAGVRVTLTAGPGLPVGVVNDWVTLNTNLPDAETLQVPILGRVEGDLSVHGPGWSAETGVLAFGIVKSEVGKKTKLRVSIKGPNAADANLAIDEVDPPELQVELGDPRQVREGVIHVPLSVEVPAGTRPMVRLNNGRKPDGTYAYPEGIVRLTSDLKSTPEIELRVRFAVEGSAR
ncbi:MAG: DUF1573 domain-containing protein [Planctomycetota bacterium]